MRLEGRDALYFLSNISPARTGLPFIVWIGIGSGFDYDVRVWVSRSPQAGFSDLIAVAIRPRVHVISGFLSPHEIESLVRWIELNRDILVRHWSGEIDSGDAISAVHSVP
jgi:hypothetical protein